MARNEPVESLFGSAQGQSATAKTAHDRGNEPGERRRRVIALDTNVLVRLVLHDDETQARAAERLVVKARREQTHLLSRFVADVVWCELVWVLTRRAGLSRDDIAAALDQLLRTELIVVASPAVIERSLDAYRNGKGDFADYLVREQARAIDAGDVVTFDRALKGEDGFRVI